MNFNDLMKENKAMIKSWLNDVELTNDFKFTDEELKLNFLKSIQQSIESDFIILTKEEYNKNLMDFHCSMEGLSQ